MDMPDPEIREEGAIFLARACWSSSSACLCIIAPSNLVESELQSNITGDRKMISQNVS